ncbi:MAG: Cas10/Cmr2 second palm domain-containing protein [Bacillota bacterium]
MGTKKDYLALVEIVKVKGFVFSSSKLKSIRGASYILDKLNLDKVKKTFNKNYKKNNERGEAEKIYFGGGNNKALFQKRDDAEDFVKEVEKMYATKAPGVKTVGTVKEKRDDEDLSDLMHRGEKEIKKGKNEGFAVGVEANPFAKYCTLCGDNLVEKYSENIEQLLCAECNEKIEKGKKINQLKEESLATAEQQEDEPKKGFKDYIYNKFEEEIMKEVEDIGRLEWPETISDLADDENFIGFIYADGNRIGSFLRKFNNEYVKGEDIDDEDYKALQSKFSDALDSATKEAVVEAVKEAMPPEDYIEQGQEYPVEFVIAGGDDLILMVPGDRALAVSDKFTKYFEDKINAKLAEKQKFAEIIKEHEVKITTSCGVAIAKSSYPINLLFDQSAQLLKNAKLRTYSLYQAYKEDSTAEHNYGAVDYDIINSSSIKKLAVKREEEYQNGDNHLTLRPYLVTQTAGDKERDLPEFLYLDNFLERVQELKASGFPQTKLRQMLDAVQLGRKKAMLKMLKLIDGLNNPEHRKLLKSFYEKINCQSEDYQGVYPWIKFSLEDGATQKENQKYVTDIVDVVETYDFVASEVE